MIIKNIQLENIRSYERLDVPFSQGVTLFEGDIASGKSTILYAIEFGLFGLGSIKGSGSFLLRNGARQGKVTLRFQTKGVEYEVQRTLVKKAKNIQQGECYLQSPTKKEVLAPTELKDRILQILHFNEPPNPRAQSVIYRYAVFTPQEEMKEVVLKEPDERLQTLRRAFNMEQYKQAWENSSTISGVIKNRITYLDGATKELDTERSRLTSNQEKLRLFQRELEPLRKKYSEKNEEYVSKSAEYDSLQTRKNEIEKAVERVDTLTEQLKEKRKAKQTHSDEIEKYGSYLNEELEPKIAELQSIVAPTDKTEAELKNERREKQNLVNELLKIHAKNEERIGNFTSLLEKSICPVCEKPVDPKDYGSKTLHLEHEKEELDRKIESANGSLSGLDTLIERANAYERTRTKLEGYQREKTNTLSYISNTQVLLNGVVESITSLENQFAKAKEAAEPLQNILTQIEAVRNQKENLENERRSAGEDVAKKEQAIEDLRGENAKLEGEIIKKEAQAKTKTSLSEYKIWVDGFFAPTIESIEKQVMTAINQRFNEQFQKWFQILLDDPSLHARVDEDFSPIMEREEYLQDFGTLSGGEKTSVALAYRLALNTLVQEVATEGENLLILDEPTDGFSKEQLYRIRDILHEIKSPQVILVSHERELEAFADQVYKVSKSDGVSKISN